MKWGVRRYQNEDGTLTELGKRRLSRYNEGRKDNKKLNEDKMTKEEKTVLAENFVSDDIKNTIAELTDEMLKYAASMEFEKAAEVRDKIKELEKLL